MQIYQYTNAAEFLYDSWAAKKAKNPAFSLRAWAKKLGLSSNAPLTLMFQGKRPIPKRYIPVLARDLELTSKETIYLETLLKYNRCKDDDSKAYYENILYELKPRKNLGYIEIEHRRMIEDPLHFMLLDIFSIPESKADPEWIQARLSFPATTIRIKQCILRLVELGLISIKEGHISRFEGQYQTKVDVADQSIREVHKKSSLLANEMIDRAPVEEREYNVTLVSLAKDDIDEVRQRIRVFIKGLLDDYDTHSKKKNCTYQLSSQFFKLFDLGGANEFH